MRIPVSAPSLTRVCSSSLAGIAGFEFCRGMDVCCQVEVTAVDRSLVQRSPTECGVSECDCGTSTMRRL